MNKKIIILLLVLAFILGSFTTIGIKNNLKNDNTEPADLPLWVNSHYWKYDMNFNFETSIFKVNADISKLKAEVVGSEFINNQDQYKLDITSDSLSGNVRIAFLKGPEIKGVMAGSANIAKDTLGMTKFDFRVDGDVKYLGKWHPLVFEMVMTFTPSFDFFDFPINPSENLWNLHIDQASIDAFVDIHIMGGTSLHKNISETQEFDDNMTLKDIREVNYPNLGIFNSFIIGGDWGENSDLYFAPELGFLTKVSETLNVNGIIAEFNLDLIETNFLSGNNQPDKPVLTSGPSEANEEGEQTFTYVGTDQDDDKIDYFIDWGDGTNTGWILDFNSGESVTKTHSWAEKGTYTILAKTRDDKGLESEWSTPHSIVILGDPSIFLTVNKIHMKDGIDIGSEAELYYEIKLIDETSNEQIITNHNTDNGKYNGIWNIENTWELNKLHEIKTNTKTLDIELKVLDHDTLIELGNDDLADVSGCNHPDTDGYDDIEDLSEKYKRGAVFHQTYDLVTDSLLPYNQDHQDLKDYYKDSTTIGDFITCGDFQPDNSVDHEEGIGNPENDCKVWFTIDTNYIRPNCNAEILTKKGNRRTGVDIQFKGSVIDGKPNYEWFWDFGDDSNSNSQNPKHAFETSGQKTINLKVTDDFNETDTYSFNINIFENNKPNNLMINGPKNKKAGETCEYDFSAEDQDGDELEYYVDWGDGDIIDWFGPYESGEKITKVHRWDKKGEYEIIFKVKDSFGAISTKYYQVSIPKQKIIRYPHLSKLLENILKNIFQKQNIFR